MTPPHSTLSKPKKARSKSHVGSLMKMLPHHHHTSDASQTNKSDKARRTSDASQTKKSDKARRPSIAAQVHHEDTDPIKTQNMILPYAHYHLLQSIYQDPVIEILYELNLEVKRAINLRDSYSDKITKKWCVVKLLGAKQEYRTEELKVFNPAWHAKFKFDITNIFKNCIEINLLEAKGYHGVRKEESLGHFKMPVAMLKPLERKSSWYDIEDSNGHIEVWYELVPKWC
eukprot:CAMPEP_0185756438 /NCGR_PEP_ID=MMETSP1174-20130828/14867_1 /TAXON_ID=35687 /ORGANISM="Dictyocha speculum, Strain CCMP1381" /LENGTH=228 /DNA_ID=CAMNT_0028435401 /DNA_START=92 /DNA_END=778 /DNA_ORIENTATION=+